MSLLALPSIRDEAWRWSDLSALPSLAEARPAGNMPETLPWIDAPGPRLLFLDGNLDATSDAASVEIADVSVTAADHPLARLVGRRGWRLRLGADRASPGIVQIIHLSTGGADHLAAEIDLGTNAQASVVETYIGNGWANRLTGVSLAKGARLMLNRRLLGADGSTSLADRADIGEGASLTQVTIVAGGADSRIDGRIRLSGEAGYAEVGGALLARGTQRHDANLAIAHEAVGGMSRQLWRSVADDTGTCSVAARVDVARGAQKTDGEQSLKGLLLARTATINAKPELEIFADDVKCAHGATVGALDQGALFYLQSRGVPAEEARAILTQAFVADAIDRIGEEKVREAFHADARSWMGAEG